MQEPRLCGEDIKHVIYSVGAELVDRVACQSGEQGLPYVVIASWEEVS